MEVKIVGLSPYHQLLCSASLEAFAEEWFKGVIEAESLSRSSSDLEGQYVCTVFRKGVFHWPFGQNEANLLNTSLTSIDLPWVLFLKPKDLNKTKEPEDAGHEIGCPGEGYFRTFWWGCAAGTLDPLAYTRASSSDQILLPYTRLRACLHGVGDPGLVGLVSFVFTLWGTQNKRNLPH